MDQYMQDSYLHMGTPTPITAVRWYSVTLQPTTQSSIPCLDLAASLKPVDTRFSFGRGGNYFLSWAQLRQPSADIQVNDILWGSYPSPHKNKDVYVWMRGIEPLGYFIWTRIIRKILPKSTILTAVRPLHHVVLGTTSSSWRGFQFALGSDVLCSPGRMRAGGAVPFECVGLEARHVLG